MAKETEYLGLYLEDDSKTKVKEWRKKMNGPDGSNMEIIDRAFKQVSDLANSAIKQIGDVSALLDTINGEVV